MGKLTIKKLNFNETMSEETACFSADLYDDGKLVAHVSNRGQGGCNDLIPAKGLTYKDVAKYDNLDTECEILTIVEDMNMVKKNQSKCLVLKKDGKIYIQKLSSPVSKCKKFGNYKFWITDMVNARKKDGYEVLNTNL